MTKKNLHNWHRSGDITDIQKSVISEFINDNPNSTFEYYLGDLKKIYYWNDILERNKSNINISGKIQQMRFFSAWWNNNLITVVNGDGDYSVWLLVYEMPSQQMNEVIEKFGVTGYSSSGYRYDLEKAKDRAWEIVEKVRGDNPILFTEPLAITVRYDDNYYSSNFPSYYKDGEVKRVEVPFSSAKSDPDAYFKPLDIVKILVDDPTKRAEGKKAPYMVHGAVYLGNRKVAHALGGNVVKIDSWDGFLSILSSANKMLRYHPVVAFKKPEKIIEHIAKIIEGKDRYFAIKGKFNVSGRDEVRANNCECFVNRSVLGLDFSELATRRIKEWSGSEFSSDSPDTSVRTNLNNNESVLGNLTSYTPYSKISEINGYRNQGIANSGQSSLMRDGQQMQAVISVQLPSYYRLN